MDKIAQCKWKSYSNSWDRSKNYVRKQTHGDAYIFTQLILTKNPEWYFEYTIVKHFKDWFLLEKTELHTAETWVNLATAVRQLIKMEEKMKHGKGV